MGIRAVFFDRDGVLNRDVGYLHRAEELEWIPGAKESVAALCRKNISLFVVTNQSGVARGYFTEDDVRRLHDFMNEELAKSGGKITEFFYCPHLKGAAVAAYDKDCDCRKPKPGMILDAVKKYALAPKDCILIGDSPRDIEAAEAAGVRGYLFDEDNLYEFARKHGIIDNDGV